MILKGAGALLGKRLIRLIPVALMGAEVAASLTFRNRPSDLVREQGQMTGSRKME